MKDKYGQEVTDDTLIADLLPEDREKISKAIANVPLGRLWYAQSVKHNKGESAKPLDQWGAEFGRKNGVDFKDDAIALGKTTYREFGRRIQLSDQEICELLTAFGVDPMPDLSSAIQKEHATRLGIRTNSSSCFVATAVYGDEKCKEVSEFRKFRDEVLLNSFGGRALVCGYYRVGPLISRWIIRWPSSRSIFRRILDRWVRLLSNRGR